MLERMKNDDLPGPSLCALLPEDLFQFMAGGSSAYVIGQSGQFGAANSDYMHYAPDGSGNKKIYTISFWLRRTLTGVGEIIASAGTSGAAIWYLGFNVNDTLQFTSQTSVPAASISFTTTQVFRDVGAWLHIVLGIDMTQATGADRWKLEVNGDEITSFLSSNDGSQNDETGWMTNTEHRIGRQYGANTNYFDGVLAHFAHVNGAKLDASYFAEEDDTGSWVPKDLSKLPSSTVALTYGSNLCSGGTAFASVSDGQAPLAFDGVTSYGAGGVNAWQSSGSNAPGMRLGYQFASAVSIRKAGIYQGWSGGGGYAVTQIAIDYSDNGTDWTEAYKRAGFIDDGAASEQELELPDVGAHAYWAIRNIDSPTTEWTVTELRMYEAATTSAFGTNGFWYDFEEPGSVTNIFTCSDEFDNADWGKTRCSITANAGTGPFGGTVADKLIPNTDANSHYVRQDKTSTADTAHTVSFYVKQDDWDSDQFQIILIENSSPFHGWTCTFDIVAGTKISNTEYASSGLTADDYGIESLGGGWFKCWATGTIGSGKTNYRALGSLTSIAGDNSKGVLIYRGQFKVGSKSDYDVQTTSASRTITNGFDKSGQQNHADTSGVTTVSDSPTDRSSLDVGNYARLSEIDRHSSLTLSHAGLRVTAPAVTNHYPVRATVPLQGKTKWNVKIITGGDYFLFGIGPNDGQVWTAASYTGPGTGVNGWGADSIGVYGGASDLHVDQNGSTILDLDALGITLAVNDVVTLAYDADSGKLWGAKNGTWWNSGNPDVGTGQIGTVSDTTVDMFIALAPRNATSLELETDPDLFSYNPSNASTFEPVCTAHLPEVAPVDPGAKIGVALYTGNGTAIGSGGKAVTGLGFQPDFFWVKNREQPDPHVLFDSLRGVGNYMHSNSTDAEAYHAETLTSFDTDGFTVGNSTAMNTNNENYVAWCIGGLTTHTDISGLMTATGATITPDAIKYDADLGFAIITYTGTGTGGDSLPNPLNQTPGAGLFKSRSAVGNWALGHKGIDWWLGTDKYLGLNLTNAVLTGSNPWNNTAPTASKITLGTDGSQNTNGTTYVCYLFADTDAIKVGSYTGNGNTDGPFVDLGGSPLFSLAKQTNAAGNGWNIVDSARSPSNEITTALQANSSAAEGSITFMNTNGGLDFFASGKKLRSTDSQINANGSTYIYLAFLKHHFGGANVGQGRAR